ncbi:MAG: carbamoyltransferase N-terminal domain-containing protein [Nibricoccus sp.]
MRILGISAFYHDSAAVLLDNGSVMAAAQEERFSRIKHDSSFPRGAVQWCLRQAGGPLDAVVYYEKPLLKFERILKTAMTVAPRGFRAFAAAIPDWLQNKLWLPSLIEDELARLGCSSVPVYFSGHHEAHAASAFFASPFERAAILTLDGVGEWTTTALGRGAGSQLELTHELRFPHSLGLLYSAFTYHCGFRVNSGEYKLMGLAPYGHPRFAELIRSKLLDLKEDGSFRMNLEYFGYLQGQTMTNSRFSKLFDVPRREPEAPMTQAHCDLARSIQEVTEKIVLRLARTLHSQTGEKNLCMAGGVALNCVANGRLLREGPFKNIWVQPAAGDAGGALGAALAVHFLHFGNQRSAPKRDLMCGAFLGPAYTDAELVQALGDAGVNSYRLAGEELYLKIARFIADGKVVGFFHGRAEFGPRALGARSILADARSPEMQSKLNLKIKFRESFRPFAPIVLAERAAEYFDLECASPYMLFTAPVKEARRKPSVVSADAAMTERVKEIRSEIPAVTHLDYSARVQTVDADANPVLRALLKAFEKQTGCPVMINTSFNVRGEPPVCHPREAIACFLDTDMDVLVLGDHVIEKSSLPKELLSKRPARTFSPD